MKLVPLFVIKRPAYQRLGLFVIALAIAWLPFLIPLHFLLSYDPNLRSIVTMGILYLEFLILLRLWGREVWGIFAVFNYYGLIWNRKNGTEFLNSLAVGLWLTLALFALMVIFGWAFLQPSRNLINVIFEGLLMSLAVGFAEELVFRGWFLDELERDYSPQISLWVNALIFAAVHFIKPLAEMIRTFPQFPGLVLLGLILVWSKRKFNNRLGSSIGLHAGLIWGYYIIVVGDLVNYSDRVSPWITGVDRNPLAGLMGLCFLGILALFLKFIPSKIVPRK
ncbi:MULTISPECIES: type II CAAX endopeptidase family protein [Spirulina sp. CCY15215]|uniref:CPBP family intramembrane glutamic endopeptidase n=1 Tax=Spirulina sp. CCY15215 TaxID=2767591 RepID=UPI001EF1E166|nr:type II CAAX endopeptidase family protein [Spirulina major]